MSSFEDIHPNKKFAFIDGLLCGLVVAWIVNMFRSSTKEL